MAVVTKEELAVYCHLDEGDLLDHAIELAEVQEERLKSKGCVDTPVRHKAFCLAVKAMTLHELDHPGEKFPQGIQDMINELKRVKPVKTGGA